MDDEDVGRLIDFALSRAAELKMSASTAQTAGKCGLHIVVVFFSPRGTKPTLILEP